MRIMIPAICLMLLTGCAGFKTEATRDTVNLAPVTSPGVSSQGIGLKKKLAIARFSNETRMANSFLNEGSGTREAMSSAANDILSAKLTQSGRFLLIERADQILIDNEARVSNIGSYKIPADYLILGSIADFGRTTTGEVGLIDRNKRQTAYAKVALRVVDTRSGRIVFAEEGAGEAYSETGTVLGMGSVSGYDETLTGKAIEAAINSAAQRVIAFLADDAWRSYILSIEDDELIIAGGVLQGIGTGDVFTVYQRGRIVDNPQTGIPIELPGTAIAKIRISRTVPGDMLTEVSFATLVEGSLPKDYSNLYIAEK